MSNIENTVDKILHSIYAELPKNTSIKDLVSITVSISNLLREVYELSGDDLREFASEICMFLISDCKLVDAEDIKRCMMMLKSSSDGKLH